MMKKLAAVLMVVVILTLGCSACFAGSVKDTSKSIWNTILNAEKTALQAVADTAVYLFTDDDAATAYASTCKRAAETKDEAVKTWDNSRKALSDAVDTVVGTVESFEAARDIVISGAIATVKGIATGDFDYTLTKEAVKDYCEAYKKADKDIVFDVCDMTGAGGPTIKALKVAKTVGEYAVGYKDGEKGEEAIKEAITDLILSTACEKLGDKIKDFRLDEVGSAAAEKAAEQGADLAARKVAAEAAKEAGKDAAELAGDVIATVVQAEVNTVINVAEKVRNDEAVGAEDIDVDPVNDTLSLLVNHA